MSFGDTVGYRDFKTKKTGDLAEKIVKRKKFYNKGKFGNIVKAWKKVVGEEIFSIARPVSYQYGKLKIEVRTPVLLHELKGFMKKTILEEMKVEPGGEDIEDIIFFAG